MTKDERENSNSLHALLLQPARNFEKSKMVDFPYPKHFPSAPLQCYLGYF